jgi:hypothetical protein
MTSKNLVLRSMYIEPEIDDMLRNEAFNSRTSKNDLIRKYLQLGIEAARKAAAPEAAAEKPAPRRVAVVSPVKEAHKAPATRRKPASEPAI